MAKSRLSSSRNKHNTIIQPKTESNVASLDLTVELHSNGIAHSTKINFLHWCNEQCDPKNELVKPSRLQRMQKLKSWVDLEKKHRVSDALIRSRLASLKLYIVFCDRNKLNPFSQAGYLSYMGNSGELWRLVGVANEPKQYDFQYCDGEEQGLLEASASAKKMHINVLLLELDFDVSEWQATNIPFSSKQVESSTQPYSSSEWYAFVRRTQLFFFSLANQLVALKEENPEAPLPKSLGNIVVERVNGRDITITLGSESHLKADGVGNLFNQCMAAAYSLFAYYTAFNDTVIRDVRHPVKFITSKVEGRTSTMTQVRAYKARGSKEVRALFARDEVEDLHPEANQSNAGFIVADMPKRDTVGSVDGIAFIRTLESLSKAYSDDPFDTLIYWLNSEGKKAKVSVHSALETLSRNLNLLSSSRSELTDHLVKTYTELIEDKKMTSFKWTQGEAGVKVMVKKGADITERVLTRRATPLAYAAITCITDVSLHNALIPLGYSDKDTDGNINISFNYVNGLKGEFTVAARYKNFFQLVESYAATQNPLPNGKGSKSSTRSSFLLPLGSKSQTAQWMEGAVPISIGLLRSCGVSHGDYFLNITSRRIRLTHSDLEYKPEEQGLTAQKILQHTGEIADKRYRNGHPVSNNKQVSQGLMTLAQIAEGKTRDEASESVKKELNIPILEYEIWKKRNQPTNPNGVSCEGQIDLVSDKDWHYAARKFAKEKGIISEGQDITCYQYDLCVFCKSAKLVDDPYAIYKLLSFLDALSEAIDQFPERASVIELKIERFQNHLEEIPTDTMDQAESLLESQGRYPLFNSLSSVTQYL